VKWQLVVVVFFVGCGPENGVGELFEAYTQQCPANTVEGVDVYQGDGTIDWTMVKSSGRVFAFIKATQGNYNKQTTFTANWANTQAVGLVRGAYHYFDATVDGVTQAQWFLDELQQAGGIQPGDLPPTLDLECPTSPTQTDPGNMCLGNGKSGWAPTPTIIQGVWDFLDTVEAATGFRPIIYSYPSWFASFGFTDAKLTNYPLWIASPQSNKCASVPAPWTTAAFWQWSSKTHVPGIGGASTNADVDRFMGTAAELQPFIVGDTSRPDGGRSDGGAADLLSPAVNDLAQPDDGSIADAAMAPLKKHDDGCGCTVGGQSDQSDQSEVSGAWLLVLALAVIVRARLRITATARVRVRGARSRSG
jgi:lysozyme